MDWLSKVCGRGISGFYNKLGGWKGQGNKRGKGVGIVQRDVGIVDATVVVGDCELGNRRWKSERNVQSNVLGQYLVVVISDGKDEGGALVGVNGSVFDVEGVGVVGDDDGSFQCVIENRKRPTCCGGEDSL